MKLVITVKELPRLANYSYTGIKKSKHSELNNAVIKYLSKGSIVTENVKQNAITAIKSHFTGKGFLDINVSITEKPDSILENALRLTFSIEKGEKVKIDDILFAGNEHVKTSKLKKLMVNTNSKINPLKTSKFIKEDYETDKKAIIEYYNTLGYRDAKIVKDTIVRIKDEDGNNDNMIISIQIEEGLGIRQVRKSLCLICSNQKSFGLRVLGSPIHGDQISY